VGGKVMIDTESDYKYKTFTRPISATWWMRNRRYFMFMIRELTSVFVAMFVLLYLYEFFLISKGAEVHGLFQQSLRSVPFIIFYVIMLIFALYHSWTWLGLTAKIQVVKLGRMTVPPALVSLGAYGSWIAATVVVGYLFLNLK
jgi:fumarate reductase subunit C